MRADTENHLQMNYLCESQEQMLAVIEQKLAEVRAHQPDTRIVFRIESVLLEQLNKRGTAPGESCIVLMLSLLIPTTVSLWQKGVTQQDMREPHGLAIHGDYLYVTDTELHVIFQFKMQPQFL